MSVFILALDGLEYDFVMKWKLRNLLQKTHGKFQIGREYWKWDNDFGSPYSPYVWTSFITGVQPHVHGITGFWTYRSRLIEFIRRLPILSKFRGKRAFLSRMGVAPELQGKRDLKVNTIFDVIYPSIAIDVLGYNPEREMRVRQFRSRNVDEYMETSKQNFLELRQRMFEKIKSSWKLLMFYIHYTDAAGHCCSFRKLKLIYQLMDLLTVQIKEKLRENTVFLIVSDHGITATEKLVGASKDIKGAPKHSHSTHAFYSLNFKTAWKPKNITDFYPKIIEWANA
ncbi:MAG: alkaline phosphatase family protein [Candidatus Bathyarchaeota archaeon]|nr:MAG: alkaline phosphatase family protein [Candidatus Bathyarchaeota archaeon]